MMMDDTYLTLLSEQQQSNSLRKTNESMEELIPIVGKLTEEFTANESSSVTYERARQFMEAVIYCIGHAPNWDYPVFGLDMDLEGIDRISAYLDAIREEQMYLRKFSRDEVIARLRSFHPHYEREYFNVREIVRNN
ncbi:MAG: DUF6179 domain-containing protein [Roseburia sp.]